MTMIGIAQAALEAYLEQHVPGFRGLRSVEKFGTGQSNPTFRLRADSGDYVLRSQPPGELLPSAHAVDREFRVMQALAGSAVPVPPVLHLAPRDMSPTGRAFYVMAHVEGRIFWDPAMPDVADRRAVYDKMNAGLAALHDVDIAAVGLSQFGKPGNYFARQLERWQGQYRASCDVALPDMEYLMGWLAAHLPPDDGQIALVHGDWRIDNIIFAAQGSEIVAVIDWELSTLGHPLADLAYQCMQWRLPHAGRLQGLGGLDRAARGLPTEAEYVADYAARRGVVINDWPFYLAFAFFRFAAILQGVAARAKAGNASNPALAVEYGRAVPQLAAMAVAVVRDGT